MHIIDMFSKVNTLRWFLTLENLKQKGWKDALKVGMKAVKGRW